MSRTGRKLALCLCVLALSCGRCDETQDAPPTRSAPLAPVPAPAGLSGEMRIRAPGALLTEVRQAMGGPSLLLPRTLGGLLVDLLGLPLQAAELFDEQLPMVAASAVDGATPHLAVAVHVRGRDRLQQLLTSGGDARFDADTQGEVIHLAPRPALREARIDASVALIDHYLVAGSSRDAIDRLGTYLTRTLSARPPPEDDVDLTLHAPALSDARARLEPLRARLQDVPPSLGLLVDGDALIDALGELSAELTEGRIRARLGDGRLELEASFAPKADAWPRLSMRNVADPSALSTLPDDSVAALSWSESDAQRSRGSRERATKITALIGGSWSERDSDALARALEAIASARGDRTLLGARCTGVGVTGFAQGGVSDADKLRDGLASLVALREHAAVKARLKEASLALSAQKTRILEVPHDVWRLRLTPLVEGAHPRLEAVDLLYLVEDDRFAAAAGMETVDTLQQLETPATSWADKPAVKEALHRLPRAAWIDGLVDPQAIHACAAGRPGGALSMPIAFAVGPRDDRVFARLEIAAPLFRVAADALDL